MNANCNPWFYALLKPNRRQRKRRRRSWRWIHSNIAELLSCVHLIFNKLFLFALKPCKRQLQRCARNYHFQRQKCSPPCMHFSMWFPFLYWNHTNKVFSYTNLTLGSVRIGLPSKLTFHNENIENVESLFDVCEWFKFFMAASCLKFR